MSVGPGNADDLLSRALASLGSSGIDVGCYEFSGVGGGTQATVWKGIPQQAGRPVVALRLTPKPLELIRRIASLVNGLQTVECPKTLSTGQVNADGRTWTSHLCTWIGTGTRGAADMRQLGKDIARLHQELSRSEADFSDRRLTFERSPLPPMDHELPAWYVARHMWRDRIYAWLSTHTYTTSCQPIHGDMHRDNVVPTTDGFGFIDFDKLMFAPPVFDLAKLIATGFFRLGLDVRFQTRRTAELLEGYNSIRSLSDVEVVAIEGLAVILNEETARLGMLYDVEKYRKNAEEVASWWISRRKRARTDPLGIRALRGGQKLAVRDRAQLALWPDEKSLTP
ncbi:MAG: phosphotransferase enzyme family protein [Pseudonocardiaceae bacterium]